MEEKVRTHCDTNIAHGCHLVAILCIVETVSVSMLSMERSVDLNVGALAHVSTSAPLRVIDRSSEVFNFQ